MENIAAGAAGAVGVVHPARKNSLKKAVDRKCAIFYNLISGKN